MATRRQLRSFATILLIVLMPVPAAWAHGLVWKSRTFEATVEADQSEVQTDFEFRNTGTRPVTIVSARSSCDCTTATFQKKAYAPGEKGIIHAVFSIGESTGLQTKDITVQTDDPEDEPAILSLRMNIKRYLAVEPQLVFWSQGDGQAEKTITCTALTPNNISVTGAVSSNPAFSTRIETVEPGRKFLIYIKPQSLTDKALAKISVTTEVAHAKSCASSVYAVVR